MARSLEIRPGLEIPLAEIEIRTSRSSGPGGQHANVTESRVEAVFEISTSNALGEAERDRLARSFGDRVTATAQDARSQTRNRELALERLAERIRKALEPRKRRRPTKPSAGATERRISAKRRRAQLKRERRGPTPDEDR